MEQANTERHVDAGPQAEAQALRSMLRAGTPRPGSVAALLDGLSHVERVRAIRTLGRGEQSALWQLVEGYAALSLRQIVPSAVANEQEVRHFGKNTLLAFTQFEKRFFRPAAGDTDEATLYGYNYQTSELAMSFTGPGYFVATEDSARGEVLIDYRRIPPNRLPSWPPIRNNERGVASLVYGNMLDTLRRVSEHVTIGRANKGGKDMSAWFVLCREA